MTAETASQKGSFADALTGTNGDREYLRIGGLVRQGPARTLPRELFQSLRRPTHAVRSPARRPSSAHLNADPRIRGQAGDHQWYGPPPVGSGRPRDRFFPAKIENKPRYVSRGTEHMNLYLQVAGLFSGPRGDPSAGAAGVQPAPQIADHPLGLTRSQGA